MKVNLLQTDIAWADPQENIHRVEAMIAHTDEDTSLYVLPEMWATGFAISPEGIAEEEASSEALAWMRQTAIDRDCAISGSLAVHLTDGTFRNRHYFVTPTGTSFYDKRHLFTHGHEDRCYTAGSQAVVVEWQGWKWLLLTCYDLRFPVFSRYGRAGLYDGIILVANWPEQRQSAWEVLTRARAMENQCYVLAVNRAGSDPVTTYVGGSMVIDPIGRIVAEAEAGRPSIVTAQPDIEKLRLMRHRFRVLSDRDT